MTKTAKLEQLPVLSRVSEAFVDRLVAGSAAVSIGTIDDLRHEVDHHLRTELFELFAIQIRKKKLKLNLTF